MSNWCLGCGREFNQGDWCTECLWRAEPIADYYPEELYYDEFDDNEVQEQVIADHDETSYDDQDLPF